MSRCMYKIIMLVPIGERRGMMEVNTIGNKIEGRMEILGHSEPFVGVIDEEGNCCIKGQFRTLMNEIPFTAQGIVREEQLHLLAYGNQDVFEIFGDICPEGKE